MNSDGLGYVSLPLAVCCANAGLKVSGFDIDPLKVQSVKKRSYIHSITQDELISIIGNGFIATEDFLDALIIAPQRH